MSKTIKFNLILDSIPVRDLEGLRNNFNLDDLLDHYRSGVLQRWLEVRGYSAEFANVKAIKTDNEYEIAKTLILIFNMEIEEDNLSFVAYNVKYRLEEAERNLKQGEAKCNENKFLQDYHIGYYKILCELIERKEDFPFIKQRVSVIHEKYLQLFTMNYMHIYEKMIKESPLVVFAMLMHPELRKFFLYIDDAAKKVDNSKLSKIDHSLLRPDMTYFHTHVMSGYFSGRSLGDKEYNQSENEHEYENKSYGEGTLSGNFNQWLKNMIKITYSGKLPIIGLDYGDYKITKDSYLYKHFKFYSGATKQYWKDIEPRDKKFMIIDIVDGNFVRSTGRDGEELGVDDVKFKFPILDGIDYKCSNDVDNIIYMEV